MSNEKFNQNFTLIEVIVLVMKNKYFILGVNFIFILSAIIYSLMIDEIYEVKTTIIPAEITDEISLKNISMLGGLSIGLTQESPVVQMIRNNLMSESFLTKYYKKYADNPNFLDKRKAKVVYKEEERLEDFIKLVRNDVLVINNNSEDNLISVSLRMKDRKFAILLLNEILADLKETIRNKNLDALKNDIVFYKQIADSTNDFKIQNTINELVSDKIKKSYTMTNNIFTVLDPPNYPDKRYWPKRTKIVIASAVVGFFFSLFALTVKIAVLEFYKEYKLKK